MSSETNCVHMWMEAVDPPKLRILQELWNFVWTKTFKNLDNLPEVASICDIISDEMLTDDINRHQLCASSHIIFATVS